MGQRFLGTLVLVFLLPGMAAAAEEASPPFRPSPMGSFWLGSEFFTDYVNPVGVGAMIGVRVHPQVAVTGELAMANVMMLAVSLTQAIESAEYSDSPHPSPWGWYSLWGVRLTPVLQPSLRFDADLTAGPGYHPTNTMGNVVGQEGETIPVYLTLRGDFRWMGPENPVKFHPGVRLLLELQSGLVPVETFTSDAGATYTSGGWVWRGNRILAGPRGEAVMRDGTRVSWDVLIGVSVGGVYQSVLPDVMVGFSVTGDPGQAPPR